VDETLHALRADGYRLAVASNGRTQYVETVLTTYRLAELFIPRVTADMVGDKTSVLRFYVYRLALAADAVVMIGDRASDVDAARAVGCRFIGCDYGHGYRHEIEAAGPLVGRFADLRPTIGRLISPA
jgi:phosphoglycolate phosphatase